MSDSKIAAYLLQCGIRDHSSESLEPVMKQLGVPILDYFVTQKDLGKMFLINHLLQEQLTKNRQEFISMYKKVNSKKEGAN